MVHGRVKPADVARGDQEFAVLPMNPIQSVLSRWTLNQGRAYLFRIEEDGERDVSTPQSELRATAALVDEPDLPSNMLPSAITTPRQLLLSGGLEAIFRQTRARRALSLSCSTLPDLHGPRALHLRSHRLRLRDHNAHGPLAFTPRAHRFLVAYLVDRASYRPLSASTWPCPVAVSHRLEDEKRLTQDLPPRVNFAHELREVRVLGWWEEYHRAVLHVLLVARRVKAGFPTQTTESDIAFGSCSVNVAVWCAPHV
ncbi:hypothetical protein AURDEDRAFT_159676 [Auricularia subglabra TFB-10046 SS5]|nr:hypothetical protein AURDEDRAFT_159676 [Auricularia subglabra TFB-10046 SS5]